MSHAPVDQSPVDQSPVDHVSADRPPVDAEPEDWALARKRVSDRRDFGSHVVAYLVVNAFVVLIWAMTGGGYFWPAWVLGGWGVGLVLHVWEVFVKKPVTDSDIEAELHRRSGRF